jgi:hypothetical protein
VLVGVMFSSLFRMVRGMEVMAMCHVSMVAGFFMVAGVMVIRRLSMMMRSFLMMLGCLAMVFSAFVRSHSPISFSSMN